MSAAQHHPTREEREEMKANGIICTLCLRLGLGHDGDHLVPPVSSHIDAHPSPTVTVRHFPSDPDRTEVYVGGWRVGTYKSAAGVQAALAKELPVKGSPHAGAAERARQGFFG